MLQQRTTSKFQWLMKTKVSSLVLVHKNLVSVFPCIIFSLGPKVMSYPLSGTSLLMVQNKEGCNEPSNISTPK